MKNINIKLFLVFCLVFVVLAVVLLGNNNKDEPPDTDVLQDAFYRVQTAADGLELPTSTTTNLSLPSTIGATVYVNWTSGNEAHITSDGKVTSGVVDMRVAVIGEFYDMTVEGYKVAVTRWYYCTVLADESLAEDFDRWVDYYKGVFATYIQDNYAHIVDEEFVQRANKMVSEALYMLEYAGFLGYNTDELRQDFDRRLEQIDEIAKEYETYATHATTMLPSVTIVGSYDAYAIKSVSNIRNNRYWVPKSTEEYDANALQVCKTKIIPSVAYKEYDAYATHAQRA